MAEIARKLLLVFARQQGRSHPFPAYMHTNTYVRCFVC